MDEAGAVRVWRTQWDAAEKTSARTHFYRKPLPSWQEIATETIPRVACWSHARSASAGTRADGALRRPIGATGYRRPPVALRVLHRASRLLG